jgi:hypothetical protein
LEPILGRSLLLALSIAAVCGCGDDAAGRDGGDGPVDGRADAGDATADAPPPTCDDPEIVDLDRLAAEDGGVTSAEYHGDTRGHASQLEPPPACTSGAGGAPEVAHRFTVPVGGRFRVTASTAEDGTDPSFDTVVYLRTACSDASSTVACNDDAAEPGALPLASRASAEVAGATPLYVIVDGLDQFAAGVYALLVRAIPALAPGSPCDPTGERNACQQPDICTAAQGSPVCAPGTPPTLATVSAQILENGRSVRAVLSGGDVDGDATTTHVDFLDDTQTVLGSGERALPAAVHGQVSFGPLVAFQQDGLLDLFPATQLRVGLIDAAGLRSPTPMARLSRAPIRDVNQSCDPAGLTDLCRGELLCSGGRCTVPAQTPLACAAAPIITSSGVTNGALGAGPGDFETGCAYGRGFGDQVYRLRLTTRADVAATTQVSPDGAADDLDTVLALRASCADPATQIVCDDDVGTDPHSLITATGLAAGDYFLIVDGSREGAGLVATGPFQLTVTITPR